LSLDVARYTEVVRSPFLLPGGLRVPAGRHEFDRFRLYGSTAGFRPWSASWDLETGGFQNGRRFDTRVGVNWRPDSHWLVGAQYQTNAIDLPGGDFTTRVYGLTVNYAFNVRWAWLNLAQYDNVSGRLGLNSRLRWWPTPGQVGYLVVNYDWREDAEGDFKPFVAETTIKLTYTLRY
jgi:hypothetical protein